MKEKLRRELIAAREAHHASGGHVHCIRIMDRFIHTKEFEAARCILLYSSIKSEVHTEGIIQSALSLGKRVVLPVTNKEEKRLELYEIKDVGELSPGAFGILEPKKDEARRVEPQEVDLAVVPGVGFDRKGHRIGYGMGYYDALLKRVGGKKVALAYGFQVKDSIPSEPHDVSVDMLVTEDEVIECKSGGGQKEEGFGKRGKIRVAVLASGRGTDFQSIIDGVKEGRVAAEIVGLITDNPSAGAIERAKKAGIPYFVVPYATREELDEGIMKVLDGLQPDLVVLAGYMKIIRNKKLLSSYFGRMINIHPSLLPKYPGAHAQRDAFEAGEKVSGYTIHFVDETLDGGPIIYQEKVDISDCKSADEAASKILAREHVGLPMVVDSFAKGRYRIEGKKVSYAPF
ncbi:MAG: phosphoribosylglycinamide formyltransferase [Candidatus Micrarchaeota archaeon]|nr:phosphoribosylglycinamide formyltransferase [Candidatus Micrarchaeota archaeon]